MPEIAPMAFIVVTVLGSIYLGLATPSEAGSLGAFVILILFLLFKPEGFFGKKIKSATV